MKIIAGCKKRNKSDAGVNKVETEELADTLDGIHQSGTTIFIVEHDMKLVMGVGLPLQLLIMDEHSLGLAPILVRQVLKIIRDLNQSGMIILLSEQNARAALMIAHDGIVMETGYIRYANTAKALQENSIVQEVFLGVG